MKTTKTFVPCPWGCGAARGHDGGSCPKSIPDAIEAERARGPSRVRAYLRVSSDEQTIENQRPDVERLAKARGYTLGHIYEEKQSAAKDRPVFQRMMVDAHLGFFETLVIWSLDRFGRSMAGNLSAVAELDRYGVTIASVHEPWLETQGPVRPLLIAIFSWIAEQERAVLVTRTLAGIARARDAGARFGRPEREVDADRAHELRAEGETVRRIAQRMKVPRSTVARALARKPEAQPPERERSNSGKILSQKGGGRSRVTARGKSR